MVKNGLFIKKGLYFITIFFWFLYERYLGHERVNVSLKTIQRISQVFDSQIVINCLPTEQNDVRSQQQRH